MSLHKQLSNVRTVSDTYRTLIRRASWNRDNDEIDVIIKSLKLEALNQRTLGQWQHEFRVLQHLNGNGAPKVHDLIFDDQIPNIVLSDSHGMTLREILTKEHPTIRRVLEIAINISVSLHAVHQRKVIHKDIKPGNILVIGAENEVQLIDFGTSSMLLSEEATDWELGGFEETLAYVSPEQTGRMNRSVDSRSDLYSLGITLFEALVGEVPFSSNDDLEVLHAHLAKQPPAADQLNPLVPRNLSRIVSKLLAKNAENRYQSAYGLQRDLERCLEEIGFEETVDFQLGTFDGCNHVRLPQKLYGRDSAISKLSKALKRAHRGNSETICISGYSGIGKTSLVNELQKNIVGVRGNFLDGKFDQYKRDIPYKAFLDAINGLVHQLAKKDECTVEEYRQAIIKAVDGNGQVLLDVIPELEVIIGQQPKVQQLQPADSQQRFQQTLLATLQACATSDHPLIIFLDDLQWADLPTLNLIRALNTGDGVGHLLLILAYRDNEVVEGHPVQRLVQDIADTAQLTEITITNLQQNDVAAFIADALDMPENSVSDLAGLCHAKTSGNPFFLGQFLLSLNRNGFLRFSVKTMEFTWCLDEIKRTSQTDNVVELMLDKLRDLPAETQNTMRYAACLGNQFDLRRLALLVEKTPQNTAKALWPALAERFLVPEDDTYKFAHSNDVEFSPTYRFAHDRLQQAAYGLISDDERAQVHRTVGLSLWSQASQEELDDLMFEIVNHLFVGRNLIEDLNERVKIATLSIDASRKAFDSNAFSTALNYNQIGLELLGDNAWDSQFDLMFSAVLNRGRVEHICGNHDSASTWFELALQNAQNALQRSQVRSEMEDMFVNLGQHHKVIDSALAALDELGIDVPDPDQPEQIRLAAQELRQQGERLLKERDISDLLDLQESNDPKVYQAHKHLRNLAPPSFFLNMELYLWLGAQNFVYTLQHGNTPLAPFNLSVSGLSNLIQGKLDRAYQLGKLAVDFSNQYDSYQTKAAAYVHFCLINSWKHHYRVDEEYSRKGMSYALEAWDQLFIAWAPHIHLRARAMMGTPLPDIVEMADQYFDIVDKTNRENAAFLRAVERMASCLIGKTSSETSFDSARFSEADFVTETCGYENPAQAFNYFIYKLQSLFILGHIDEALVLLKTAAKFESPQWVEVTEYYFYRAMILACAIEPAEESQQADLIAELRDLHGKLNEFANQNPENFECRFCLVDAELAIVEGRKFDAVCSYKAAIESACNQEFLQIEAIAHERIGRFWRAENKQNYAQLHLVTAARQFGRWGAKRKVNQLKNEFGDWLELQSGFLAEYIVESGANETTSKTHDGSRDVDVATLIKASQAISTEIKLDKLLARLMNVVSENAGATRGVLLLNDGDTWTVEVEWTTQNGAVALRTKQPLERYTTVAHTMIQEVAQHGEPIVAGSAFDDNRFANDKHIQTNKIGSVLCLPVQHRGRNVAVLYLENGLVDDVFTAGHIRLLTMLTSQIAISIENARVYAEMEDRVKQRTAELEESNNELAIKSKELAEKGEHLSKLALVAKYTSNSVVITDENGRTEWVNAGFCSLTGYSEEEVIGKIPGRLLQGEKTSQQTIDQIRRSQQLQQPFAGELINYTKSGEEYWVFLQINPVYDETGKVTRHIGVVTDITERKRIEFERAKLENELRDAARIAGRAEIATGVLHNVGNVLNSVNTSVSVLQHQCRSKGVEVLERVANLLEEKSNCLEDFVLNDPKAKYLPETLSKISDSMQRERDSMVEELCSLASNVDHIKTIVASQQEMAKSHGMNQNLSVSELIDDAVNANIGGLTDHGIRISIDSPNDLPQINSDKHKLMQILINLIANARDSVVEAGTADPAITIKLSQNHSGLEIGLSDNGLGISADKLGEIFQYGFTTKKHGHGFGLHSSANVAVELGGSLKVASEGLGHGATFTLFVPFDSQGDVETKLAEEPAVVGAHP